MTFTRKAGTLPAYWELTKFRLVSLVLLSASGGFYLASEGPMRWRLFAWMLLGTALVAAGSMVFNQWMERTEDSLMARTAARPIPTDRVSPTAAILYGGILSLAGLAVLWFYVNGLTVFLAAMTHLFYVLLYTPLKRYTSFSIVVGSFPGALPPLIGWAAASGKLALEAGILFAIIFLWQMPHFLAIAWMGRKDYAKAGLKMLPATDPQGWRIGRLMLYYAIPLLPVSLMLTWAGLTGMIYFYGALALGISLIVLTLKTIPRMDQGARPLFRFSLLYLSVLFILMLADKT